ncbi:Tether containing UBX domain for GLUT4 [Blattella germanica]|nr:Tether containing UBX domain for GLUT4 [Blattella germanica]
MAANKCFVVLAPNGRRQNVKVSPNTTILQVLEEVCKKQGFKPEEYDIKHQNHILDTTQIIRFAGLPNNAFLEMKAAQKIREEKSVVLGLQLESDTLWNVIKKLCPAEADPNSNPVIIYMRREVSGMEALEETTLRSLGLTGGRAMLSKLDGPPEHPSSSRTSNISAVDSLNKGNTDISRDEETKLTAYSTKPLQTNQENEPPVNHNIALTTNESTCGAVDKSYSQDHRENMDVDTSSNGTSMTVSSSGSSSDMLITQSERRDPRERNAVAFSLDKAPSVPYEDLPEDFFDLTLEDARAVYRDLKRKRAEMEEAPLTTSAQRSLEESKRILSQLHEYRRTVIRIQFPDRTVLQGTFLPLETVSTVMDFVRVHLEDPHIEFHLYTTPPKNILPLGVRLVDAECVPNAMVHFGTDVDGKTFLRAEILSKFSSPSAATIAACKSRGIVSTPRPFSAPSQANPNRNVQSQVEGRSDEMPSTSSQRAANASRQPRQGGGPSSKVPKWFKSTK